MTQDNTQQPAQTCATTQPGNSVLDGWHAQYQFFLWPPLEPVVHGTGQEVRVGMVLRRLVLSDERHAVISINYATQVYVKHQGNQTTGRAVVLGPPVHTNSLPLTWSNVWDNPHDARDPRTLENENNDDNNENNSENNDDTTSDNNADIEQPSHHIAKAASMRCPVQYVCCGVRYMTNVQRLICRYAIAPANTHAQDRYCTPQHTPNSSSTSHLLSPHRYRVPGKHRVVVCHSTPQYRILAKTQVSWDDHVVELGSSMGVCTAILASHAASVVGFEVLECCYGGLLYVGLLFGGMLFGGLLFWGSAGECCIRVCVPVCIVDMHNSYVMYNTCVHFLHTHPPTYTLVYDAQHALSLSLTHTQISEEAVAHSRHKYPGLKFEQLDVLQDVRTLYKYLIGVKVGAWVGVHVHCTRVILSTHKNHCTHVILSTQTRIM